MNTQLFSFRRTLYALPLLLLPLLALSCDDNAEGQYSTLKASFTCQNVSTIAPLAAALNSYGQYCRIWTEGNKRYHFESAHLKADVPFTQIAAYSPFRCQGGFIVGKSALSDIGSASYPLLCFDLACPNCLKDDVAKRLSFYGGAETRVRCDACHRVYDLNNKGVIIDGEQGRKLIRYHISFQNNTMSIQN